jgi:predicted dehydrogenase
MNNTQQTTRRDFLKHTGQAAAAWAAMSAGGPALLAAKAPNETVGVGCIGLGTRGGDLINSVVYVPGVKVVAVCDVYGPHRLKGVERSQNPDVKAYVDYRELLADKNVDAVVIAAPDHWHCQMVLDAVQAGKDIYCEKGFSRTLPEAKRMREAIKRSRIVFQLGHQARQATCALQARELIAQGLLGPVTLVRTGRYGNLPLGQNIWRWYGYYSAWDHPDPAKVVKEVDWKLWLGSAPSVGFNERHFWHWRCYWNYGTGQAGDLLSHELDFVQYILGYGIPDTCLCAGLNALLKDDREVPDTWNAIYQYEKQGCTVIFDASMNTNIGQPVEFCGKEAFLRFDGIAHDASGFTITREGFNKRADLPKGYEKGKTPAQPNHMMDFFNCVRSRGTPKCPVDEAFVETATFLMSVESYQKKRLVRWDPSREEIV